ncbi:MAG: hypothetical protein AAF529_09305 [Pseudomonadota bacterium]
MENALILLHDLAARSVAVGSQTGVLVMMLVLCIASCAACVSLWLMLRRQHQEIAILREQVGVFLDAAMHVGEKVQRLSVDHQLSVQKELHQATAQQTALGVVDVELPADVQTAASRRWLLKQAQQRIVAGQRVELVARNLNLSSDEARMLRATAPVQCSA